MSDDEYSDDVSLGSDDESLEQELAKPFTKNTLKSNLPSFVKKASNLTLEGDDDELDGEDSEDEDLGDEDVGEDLEGGDIEDIEDDNSEDETEGADDEEDAEPDFENKTKKSTKKTISVNPSNTLLEESIKKNNILVDVDSDDEDEEDEHYLQKFNADINQNVLMKFHPETVIHNYDEISVLTKIVKDKNGVIVDPIHRTASYLTKYEKARVLGQRAKQIECGAKAFIKVPENIIDSYIIAELELKEKKIPFIIRRPLSNGTCEYWNLRDLEIISF